MTPTIRGAGHCNCVDDFRTSAHSAAVINYWGSRMHLFTIEVMDDEVPALSQHIEEYKRGGGSIVAYIVPENPAITTNMQSKGRWRCEVPQEFLDRFPHWKDHVVRRG
jgi:hypothetical protein